jgi:hypothetical protein
MISPITPTTGPPKIIVWPIQKAYNHLNRPDHSGNYRKNKEEKHPYEKS